MRRSVRSAGSSWKAALLLALAAAAAWQPAAVAAAVQVGQAAPVASATAAAWSPIGPPDGATVQALAFAPSRPAVVYAGLAGGGVHRSDDGGATWTPAGFGLDNPAVSSLAVDPTNPDAVYAATQRGFFRSADGGRTWQTAPTVNTLKAHAVAVDPVRPQVLYLGTAMGLFRSDNRGVSWKLLTVGLIPPHRFDFEVVALAIDAVHPSQVYAAHIGVRDGIHKTVNGGRVWVALRRIRVDALAVDPVQDAIVWAAGDDGVWYSVDGGQRFTKVRVEPAHALLIDPFDHTRVYAANAQDVQVTTDGGYTWETLPAGPLPGGALALAADPSAPGVLLAGATGAGVYRSTDGGGTWTASGQGLINTPVSTVVVDGTDAAIFAVGPAGIYRSRSGGSWDLLLSSGGGAVALAGAPSQPRTLYAAIQYGPLIVRTLDSGDNWEDVSSMGATALAVSLDDPATLFAGTPQGLMKSTDGGVPWTTVFQGSVSRVVADPLDPAVLYLVSTDFVTGQVWKSRDGGSTWAKLLSDGPMLGIAVGRNTPRTILVSGPQTVFGSTDGGRIWSKLIQGFPLPYALAVDPRDGRVLYIGGDSGLLRSTDGTNWQPFEVGLYARGFNQLLFDPNDPFRLYAAAAAAGVFVYEFPH
ncbi:MAG TPA: hypothetical protein VE075_08590 [Thermoanaerobaculia bacterium]|nr:hypothetical protein [Thermoanaerobaculia bacterium]